MEEKDIMKQQIELLNKEVTLLTKSFGIEMERLSKVIEEIGRATDVAFVEISTLIEYLISKNVVTEKDFADMLHKTVDKLQEEAKKIADGKSGDEQKIEKL